MNSGGSNQQRWSIAAIVLVLAAVATVVPTTATAVREDGNEQSNPDFDESCGTDVVVILDESGSIQAEGAIGEVEDAVSALADGLVDTGSRMRIVEFSTNARDAQVGASAAFQTVDAQFQTSLATYLSGGGNSQLASSYNPNQSAGSEFYTNWEAALNEAATTGNDSATPPSVGDGTPLVVFITDGGPNTTGTNGGSLGSGGATGSQAAADAAIDEMSRLQASGSHVLSIGVGQASENTTLFTRLGNITEPGLRQSWTGGGTIDLATVDIIDAGAFGDGTLQEAIEEVVYALCGSSLTIAKIDDAGQPVVGRNFDLTIGSLSGGSTFEWELPDEGPTTTGQPDATQGVATGPGGLANFKWTPGSLANPQPWNSTVSFTETLPAGWGIGDVTCRVNGVMIQDLPVATNGQVVQVGPFAIGRNDAASCDVENLRPATITITKVANPADGTDFGFTTTSPPGVSSPLPGGLTLDVDSDDSEPDSRTYEVSAGSYTMTESPVDGDSVWDLTSIVCVFATQGQGSSASGALAVRTANITVVPGDDVICTFSNHEVPEPQISVTKTAAPTTIAEPSGNVVYGLTVTNTGQIDVQLDALSDGVELRASGISTTHDLAQPTPAAAGGVGGTFTANTCDELLASNPTIVANGGTVNCSFTVAYAGRNAGQFIDDVVTATASDEYDRVVQASDDAAVEVTDVRPTVLVTKGNVETELVAPGGTTNWTILVENPASAVESIWIREFDDQMMVDPAGSDPLTDIGAALDIATVGGPVTATTCDALVDLELAPGESESCTVTVDTAALAASFVDGDQLYNEVTVHAEDDDGTNAEDTDDADRPVVAAPPLLDVWKTDGGVSIPESGTDVTYHVWIDNVGQAGVNEPLTVIRLVDEIWFPGTPTTDPANATIVVEQGADPVVDHDLPDGMFVSTTCADVLGTTLEPATGMSLYQGVGSDAGRLRPTNADARTECTITLHLSGNAGEEFQDLATVTALDPDDNELDDDNSADTPLVDENPVVSIVKTPSTDSLPEPGGSVTFTFEITNASNANDPITITGLDDDVFGDLLAARDDSDCDTAFDGTSIAPGDSASCTLGATFTGRNAGDVHQNTVTVSAVDDEGTTADPSTDDAEVTFTDVLPEIAVRKTAIAVDGAPVVTPPATVSEHGGNVTFQVEVDNLVQEPLYLTELIDDRFGDLDDVGTCAVSDLGGAVIIPVGGTYTCTFTAFVAQPDQLDADSSHVNVVAATAEDDEENVVTEYDREVVDFELDDPIVTITKTDGGDDVTEPGGNVEYTIEIVNGPEAEEDLVGIMQLTDTITYVDRVEPLVIDLLGEPGGDVVSNGCPTALSAALPLAPSESVECSFTVVLTGTAQLVEDSVDVVAVDNDGDEARDDAPESTPILNADVDVELTKVATPDIVDVGDSTLYAFTITNPNPEPLYILSLIDDRFGDLNGLDPDCTFTDGAPLELAPTGDAGDAITCEIELTPVFGEAVDLDREGDGTHTNIVTVRAADDERLNPGENDEIDPIQTSAEETVYATPSIEVTKVDDVSTNVRIGEQFSYDIAVTNHGPFEVQDVSVTDDLPDGLTPISVNGGSGWTCNADSTPTDPIECDFEIALAPGATTPAITVTVEVEVDAIFDDELIVNAAVATGRYVHDNVERELTDDDEEETPLRSYDIGIVKSASGVPGGTLSNGEQFTYTLEVTNNGTGTATDVVVTDQVPGRLQVNSISGPGWTNQSSGNSIKLRRASLAPGASVDVVLTVTLLPASVPEPMAILANKPAPPLPDIAVESLLNAACVDAAIDEDPTNDCDEVVVPVDDIVAVVYVRCVNDAPLMGFEVQTTPSLAGEPITLTWTPNSPTALTDPDQIVFNLQSGDSDEVPWPGAVFNTNGVSTDYPGWREIEESDYVSGQIPATETVFNGLILDDSELDYAWRLGTTLTFSVNPTITFQAGYPAATSDCAVQRSTELDIVKNASVDTVNAGSTFSYTIDVTNVSTEGAAEPVILTDPIPSQFKVESITTSTTAFPRWTDCDVIGEDSNGYGGQLRCDLFGPLQMGEAAPRVTLSVRANPSASGTVINTAVVTWQLANDPESPVTFSADSAPITISAIAVQPLTPPAAPRLPPTGSNSTQPLLWAAFWAIVAGGAIVLITRRRRSTIE